MRDIGPPDAILTTSAGCGAHMQSFGTLLAAEPLFAEDAREFGEKVMDVTTFLATPHLLDRLLPQLGPLPDTCLPLAYDDPCHLCHGQGIRSEPRRLLDAIPASRRVELELSEACCGSAGLYSLEHPDRAAAHLAPKLIDLQRSEPPPSSPPTPDAKPIGKPPWASFPCATSWKSSPNP
ncbi:MAG: heterodisulfide reductase-related iron-sulfur binding cluster [Planctomycetota bacterium]